MRLVRLAPSQNFGHISVVAQLIETTWDECTYEALSYCWGKRDQTKTLLLNGEPFQVTSDLHDALEQFSLPDSSRMLWIDAICINQYDAEEKSLQVQRMQEIYRNAERVLVWVGQAFDHTEQAFQQVQSLLSCADVDGQSEIWNNEGEWITCLNKIIARPYWSRAWTVQEVVLARTALLCCGPHTIPFFEFAQFLLHKMTRERIRVNYALSSYLRQVFQIREASYEDPPMGLFGLAYKLRYRQCTVSHDKLYAFLGLLKAKDSLSTEVIPVDYAMDPSDLWMTFAKATMSKYETLLPLALAEMSRHINARWCLDWSHTMYEPNEVQHERRLFWTGGLDNPDYYPLQLPRHSAAGELPARIRLDFEAPSVISAEGFTVSKVAKVGASVPALTIGFGRPNYVKLFKEWETLVGGPWKNPDMTAEFAHTVTGGAWGVEPADWRGWNTKDYSEKPWSLGWLKNEFLEDEASTTGYEMSHHVEIKQDPVQSRYNRIRDDACEERRMFLLENGDFGLGPETTKVGDHVVILLGSQVPLVLHRRDYSGFRSWFDTEDKGKLYKPTWKILGQAYIHARMKYPGHLGQDIRHGKVVLEEYLFD
ncbi:HET-domain-containing [Fusarium albosuccineum]|uniref:HET-domain-containing n=1 Tax=Fusarium albosuccineum TaxID=1237068 RepID=A0A8H4P4Q1_9HYPO|nr:HET-domain-containing [Fusarium albosuccineum]